MMGFRQKQIYMGRCLYNRDAHKRIILVPSSFKRDNNFILTECKGHTRIYWPALTVWTECSSFCTEMTGTNVHQYGSSKVSK